tara:strand:+ start:820 stop:1389 length:570 start_codon:yes stop_codon:yes gene_type:complete
MKFLEKYRNKKNIRFELFKKTLEIAKARGVKTIVETGTSRGKIKFFFFKKDNWKDGMSTLIFSEFANYIGGELHSCDISEENISNAKHFTKKFKQNTYFYIQDSVIFLKNFKQQIDFLYLDSFDGHNPELASNHQLMEAKMAIKNLTNNSIVLLDDKGAKTNYSIKFFKDNGFKILIETNNQVLLSISV